MVDQFVSCEVKRVSIKPQGTCPETIPKEMLLKLAEQLEEQVDLRARYLVGEFELPTSLPLRYPFRLIDFGG